ncbi:MAG: sigma-70 family RNA polymerase sigma factor [Myxococcota bacterium]|nr:sigma-70 family RNA polymerase sigma factor [Myxococcota bacterium]
MNAATPRQPSNPMHRTSHPSKEGVVHVLPLARTDAALVGSLKLGEIGSADLLFERYGGYVERLVVRVLGIDSEVPDIINEVFARTLESVHSLRDPAAFKGFIGSIAIFTARVFLRKRRTRRRWLRFVSPEELPEMPATNALPEVSQVLARTYVVLDTLPADERIAFALRFVDGMELTAIAEVVGVSLATVKRRLSRAQQLFGAAAERDPLLREHLADEAQRRSQ